MSWTCPSCNFDENDDSVLRCSCGYEIEDKGAPNYNKIGGALYLVVCGLVITPIYYIILLLKKLEQIQNFTATFYFLEGVQIILLILIPLILLFMLLKRKRKFPLFAIIYYGLWFSIAFLTYLIIKATPGLPNYYDQLNSSIDKAVISFISSIAWICYFKFSYRVKMTFIK